MLCLIQLVVFCQVLHQYYIGIDCFVLDNKIAILGSIFDFQLQLPLWKRHRVEQFVRSLDSCNSICTGAYIYRTVPDIYSGSNIVFHWKLDSALCYYQMMFNNFLLKQTSVNAIDSVTAHTDCIMSTIRVNYQGCARKIIEWKLNLFFPLWVE